LDRVPIPNCAKIKDLSEQNIVLHQHLDSVYSQAARIRQTAKSSSSAQPEIDTADNSGAQLAKLRSVMQYLRKEKGIVDLQQLELSKQERARLNSQIEHCANTLDETRTTLSEVQSMPFVIACVKLISVSGT
jgi:nucleoprotein TPR